MTRAVPLAQMNSGVVVDAASGTAKSFYGTTGGLTRWEMRLGNATAEPGSGNVGSDFALARYNDAGTVIDTPLVVVRSSGSATFSGAVAFNGAVTFTSSPTLPGYLPLAGGTLTGALTLNADPTTNLGAATKQYSDKKLLLTGGTLTGALNGTTASFSGAVSGTTASFSGAVNSAGGALTGPLTLAADPTIALGAATKQYVDKVTTTGVTDGSDATAGQIGEIKSIVTPSPGSGMVSGTVSTTASISLPAGDWDVSGEVWIQIGTGAASTIQAAISLSTTIPAGPAVGTSRALIYGTYPASTLQIFPIKPCRVSISIATTVNLLAAVTYPSGQVFGYGVLWARRAR